MKRKKVGDLNFFELLNIHESPDDEQVERAYLKLTSLYSDGSIALYGALTQSDMEWMLSRIRSAYETLIRPDSRHEYAASITGERADNTPAGRRINTPKAKIPADAVNKTRGANLLPAPAPDPFTQKISKNTGEDSSRISGSDLRDIRLAKGLSLKNVADITKIKRSYLEALERDDFDSFPATVFIKGFLKSYAKALRLDPNETSRKYFDKT